MIVIPAEYGYPIASVLSTFYLLVYQMIRVGQTRKAAGIPYPQPYAEKAEMQESKAAKVFNCAQRAHQNTLENLPIVTITTLIAGTLYPTLAAGLCGGWTVCRFFYTIGYGSGDPAKRNSFGANAVGSLVQFSLLLTASWTTLRLVTGL